MNDKPPSPLVVLTVLTAEQIVSKLAELRTDRSAWVRLENKWGRVESLEDEIESYEWLRADRAAWARLENKWGRVESLENEIESYEWLLGNDPSLPDGV